MQVLITGRHMEVSEALRQHIEARMKRLERYGLKCGDAQVVLDVQKYRHSAELTLSLNGARIQGRASTNEMYASIDQLFEKVSRQVRKHKERLVNHKPRPSAARPTRHSVESEAESLPLSTVRMPLRTLTPAEAVDCLGDAASAICVFQDAASKRVQIARRLDNGRVEVIDPYPE
jgi:putative sigma-54 modulation protein